MKSNSEEKWQKSGCPKMKHEMVQQWRKVAVQNENKSGCPKMESKEKWLSKNEKHFKLNNLPAWYVSIAIRLIQPAKCQLGAVYV